MVAIVHDLAREERRTIAARYLIDCSGGHSPIRRALGIEMSGSPYIGYHLSIYVRAPQLWTHHDKGKAALVNFVEPQGLWRNLVTLDGRELYRFGLRGKEFYDDPDKVDVERLFEEVVGKQIPHEIISVRRWTARNVVADRYQVGAVFLAGDAAHLNHPASGLGLNTGLGDAVDLGWKLEAALAGWGGRGPACRPTRSSGGRSASAMSAMPTRATPTIATRSPIPPSPTTVRKAPAPAARWARRSCAPKPANS